MLARVTARWRPLALAPILTLVGCLPQGKSDIRKAEKDGAVTPASYQAPAAGQPGQVFAPKRTRFSVAILSRPAKDPAVETAPWSVADEMVVPSEARAALEANGLRVGLIRGSLPMEIAKLLDPEPPTKKPEVVEVEQPDGQPYLLDLAAASESVTLLVSRDGRASGKDYKDAKGLIRVTASGDDSRLGPREARARDPPRARAQRLRRAARARGRSSPRSSSSPAARPRRRSATSPPR